MRILLAEDEKALSDAEVMVLRHFGYEVDAAYDGAAALEMAEAGAYDCIVLDIMMPKMDGIEVLQKIRAAGNVTPVMMLTAKTEVDDRIGGLDAGADDYLTKPFAMGEFLARIRSMARRANAFTPKTLTVGRVTLKVEEQELSAESAIRLGSKETKLMKLFMQNEGKEISKEEILSHVWADEPDVPADIVWMYISFLKEKLAAVHGGLAILGEDGGPFVLATGEPDA